MSEPAVRLLPGDDPEDYARALLNILDDFGGERERFGDTQRAILNILDDVEAEKRRLEQLQSAVLNVLEDLDVEKRKAEQANRLKSEFLANMSHELRTPLNAIIGFAKLMAYSKAGPVSAMQKEFLDDILKSSDHLLQLINDVLDLAKVEAGKMEIRPEPTDIARLLREVRDILRTTSAAKRIEIDVQIDPDCAWIDLDPAKLKQVLYNYLSNALKFTGDGGRVAIRVWAREKNLVRFEVEDNGIGIDASDLPRLFSEFRQLDSGVSKKYQGTGLGLALTKRIVEAQGGTVGVTSVLGKGSVFFAELTRRTEA
jgi:signal transduction histidine kinase